MKQTAVEWLKKELESYGDPQYCELKWETLDELIEQAKEMEISQKAEEYLKGFKDGKEYQIKLTELTSKSE